MYEIITFMRDLKTAHVGSLAIALCFKAGKSLLCDF